MTESPRLRLAMPIAHVTGIPYYGPYYFGTDCVFQVTRYFDQNGCEGLEMQRNPAAAPELPDSLWDLYAMTAGHLFLQGSTLVLRLPRELASPGKQMLNSGKLFHRLNPHGPQLRYIRYKYTFDDAKTVGVEKSDNLFQRILSRIDVSDTKRGDVANQKGRVHVKAGQKIGNFKDCKIEISFLDSCGHVMEGKSSGRPLNPAYFLYVMRSSKNKDIVHWLTAFPEKSTSVAQAPLDFLLDRSRMGGTPKLLIGALDLGDPYPPRPLHITVNGSDIANQAIPMRDLGDWHESMNSVKPETLSPVKWRLYGNLTEDTDTARIGHFLTSVKEGKADLLYNGSKFDHQFTPTDNQINTVKAYWELYHPIFNVIADAFQIPVELLISVACAETAFWFNSGRSQNETSVIRFEPLNSSISKIEKELLKIRGVAENKNKEAAKKDLKEIAELKSYLENYKNMTQKTKRDGKISKTGANAGMPLNWKVAVDLKILESNPLTWRQLILLIENCSKYVRLSPGMMQTLLTTVAGDFAWAKDIYGYEFLKNITCISKIAGSEEILKNDSIFENPKEIFIEWLGVSHSENEEKNRFHRAFNSLIAGAIHIKRSYNSFSTFNLVSDFDPPTIFSAYNDSATIVSPASTSDTKDDKIKKQFVLRFYDSNYPHNATRYYNAAVSLFNSLDTSAVRPSVRIWRDKK